MVAELRESPIIGVAIIAAFYLEAHIPWDRNEESVSEESESETDDISENEAAEQAIMDYKYALWRVQKAYPTHEFGVTLDTTAAASAQNSQPCACGQGRTGHWPWQLQPPDQVGAFVLLMTARLAWMSVKRGSGRVWGRISDGYRAL